MSYFVVILPIVVVKANIFGLDTFILIICSLVAMVLSMSDT